MKMKNARLNISRTSRKGQFYILTIIILLLMVFLAIPKLADLPLPEQNPASLFADYTREVPYFANNAILTGDDSVIRNFTMQFHDFALEEGTEFSLTYIFTSSKGTRVFTTAQNVSIRSANQTIRAGESYDAGKVKFINLTIDDKQYDFPITLPSFKAVLIAKDTAENGNTRQKDVFIYG